MHSMLNAFDRMTAFGDSGQVYALVRIGIQSQTTICGTIERHQSQDIDIFKDEFCAQT